MAKSLKTSSSINFSKIKYNEGQEFENEDSSNHSQSDNQESLFNSFENLHGHADGDDAEESGESNQQINVSDEQELAIEAHNISDIEDSSEESVISEESVTSEENEAENNQNDFQEGDTSHDNDALTQEEIELLEEDGIFPGEDISGFEVPLNLDEEDSSEIEIEFDNEFSDNDDEDTTQDNITDIGMQEEDASNADNNEDNSFTDESSAGTHENSFIDGLDNESSSGPSDDNTDQGIIPTDGSDILFRFPNIC